MKRWIATKPSQHTAACWGGGIKARELHQLNKLVRKALSVVGLEQAVAERRMRDYMKTFWTSPPSAL